MHRVVSWSFFFGCHEFQRCALIPGSDRCTNSSPKIFWYQRSIGWVLAKFAFLYGVSFAKIPSPIRGSFFLQEALLVRGFYHRNDVFWDSEGRRGFGMDLPGNRLKALGYPDINRVKVGDSRTSRYRRIYIYTRSVDPR